MGTSAAAASGCFGTIARYRLICERITTDSELANGVGCQSSIEGPARAVTAVVSEQAATVAAVNTDPARATSRETEQMGPVRVAEGCCF